uniref:uncharacterized protein LOC114596495 n=1 Tax=Podarcis muralis TaxID=64176 RepID=UPI0010A035CF|nr:uncharacterized protein LOC114596495 [Podarcis muralis]
MATVVGLLSEIKISYLSDGPREKAALISNRVIGIGLHTVIENNFSSICNITGPMSKVPVPFQHWLACVRMEKYYSFVVIFCAVFLPKALGFPYKDVSIDCFSMLPNCGGGPQTSTPPYVVSVSFDRYDPGNEIQVTLEGTSSAGFTAFMVQAREIDGNVPVGMFRIRDPNTQGYPCANMTNSAVSHTNPSVKRKVTTTWVAPQGTNKIRLMATFLQDYDTYWVGVHSKTLSPRFSEVNVSLAANSSDLANDSVASTVSDITDDSEEYDDDFDFNTLLGDTEAVYDNEIPVDSEATPDRTENATEKSKRKSVLTVNVNCGEAGAVQSSSGGCVKSTQGSSQSSGSEAKVIVVKEGSSSGSGCGGGGTASVYNKFGCRDNAAASGSQSSYGQSVSTSKVKVVTYPESKPFPPERDSTYPSKIANAGGIIYSQVPDLKVVHRKLFVLPYRRCFVISTHSICTKSSTCPIQQMFDSGLGKSHEFVLSRRSQAEKKPGFEIRQKASKPPPNVMNDKDFRGG